MKPKRLAISSLPETPSFPDHLLFPSHGCGSMGLFLNRKKAGKIHWLLLLMHLPLVASLGPRNSMGWWRSLFGAGWGMKKDHVSEGRRILSWQNPNDTRSGFATHLGGGFFFGVSELPWFSGAKNSPCLTSRGLCLSVVLIVQVWRYLSGCITWSTLARGLLDGIKGWSEDVIFSIHKTFFVVFLRDIDGRYITLQSSDLHFFLFWWKDSCWCFFQRFFSNIQGLFHVPSSTNEPHPSSNLRLRCDVGCGERTPEITSRETAALAPSGSGNPQMQAALLQDGWTTVT